MYSDSDVFCNIFFSLKASKTRLMIHDFYVVWKKSIAKVHTFLPRIACKYYMKPCNSSIFQNLFWTWTDLTIILYDVDV